MSNNCGRIIPFYCLEKIPLSMKLLFVFCFVLLGFYVLTTATPNVL